MAETEERKLGLSQDDLARKILSTMASAENPSGNVYAFVYALLIGIVDKSASMSEHLRTRRCPQSDSNRHWKDFKSS